MGPVKVEGEGAADIKRVQGSVCQSGMQFRMEDREVNQLVEVELGEHLQEKFGVKA